MDEKRAVDPEATSAPVESSRWSKLSIASIISSITLLSVLAYFVTAKTWSPPLLEEPVENSEEFHDYLARATGDQYLLGVGKGDITGLVNIIPPRHIVVADMGF